MRAAYKYGKRGFQVWIGLLPLPNKKRWVGFQICEYIWQVQAYQPFLDNLSMREKEVFKAVLAPKKKLLY